MRSAANHSGAAALIRFSLTPWRGWLLIAAATLLSGGIAVLQPWPLELLVDTVLGSKPMPPWLRWMSAGNPLPAVAVLAAAQVILVAADLVLVVALSHWWITVGQKLVYDLTCRLFAAAQRRSLLFHSRNAVGDLISRITGDSWCVYGLATALVFTPIHAIVMTVAMAVVLWRLNPMLAILSLAIAPLLSVGAVWLGRLTRGAADDQRKNEARIESHIQQTLGGIPVVQAFAQEDRQHREFVEMAGAAVSAQKRAAVVAGISNLFSGGLSAIGTAVILYLGCRQVLAGKLTTGELLVFLAYLGALHGQLLTLAGTWIGAQGTAASIGRIRDLMVQKPEVLDPPDAIRFPHSPAGCHIKFNDVWFGYDPAKPVLRGVSFDALPGETVAIVGESGAGKSTLASLLLRLFDPDRGRIMIGGTDLRFFALADLRRNVVPVLQEHFLTAASVADNIAFGHDADPIRIESAATIAAAADFINRLDDGYDTVLGESGVSLSGGERQRLAIARAVVRCSPVLILDEPSSALDSLTESILFENLPRQRKRTTILITHRLSTARPADRIVFLEAGRVLETGTHDQLVAGGGSYARLWDLQCNAGSRAAVARGVS
jgi:ATP-binding cassette subfamily B protein/subfamily B ATP-binding cassette protein MsbA